MLLKDCEDLRKLQGMDQSLFVGAVRENYSNTRLLK